MTLKLLFEAALLWSVGALDGVRRRLVSLNFYSQIIFENISKVWVTTFAYFIVNLAVLLVFFLLFPSLVAHVKQLQIESSKSGN